MSYSTINNIKERILEATKKSPIAVFKVIDEKFNFDAVFSSTVRTQKMINDDCGNLVGVFFGKNGVGAFDDYIIRS